MGAAEKLRSMLFAVSALQIGLGVFITMQPLTSATILVYVFAAIIFCFGLVDLIVFLVNKEDRAHLAFQLARAVLFFILAIFMAVRAAYVSAFLPFLFGLVLIIDGLSKIVTAFEIKANIKSWKSVLVLGLIVLVVGVVILLDPFKIVKVTMMIIGISLICDGMFNIWTQINHRRHVKIQTAMLMIKEKK
ncbi:MAG: DUF308 domain-containing protein [Clostridia bacterium]|nr:DUF308 domain-containing protein [Clostridia bacterium]